MSRDKREGDRAYGAFVGVCCPSCGWFASAVHDSRPVAKAIRRRRVCEQCDLRFTTYERVERFSLDGLHGDGI